MTFFYPTNRFVDWLVKLAGHRPIIDCGCGEGLLVEKLFRHGAAVLGVDIRRLSEQPLVVVQDAETFEFPNNSVVLFCRPCHSDWVERTIKVARRSADVILYIGKAENVECDLGDFLPRFKCIGKNVGKEGEYVWQMRRIGNDITRWCLVKTTFWRKPSWMEDLPGYWGNMAGGRCPKSAGDVVWQTVSTDDISLLDWKLTGLSNPESEAGWLSPAGEWHGCDSREHRLYADMILHMSDSEALMKGWCKVYGIGPKHEPNFFLETDLVMTPEQANWLRSRGYQGWPFEDSQYPMLAETGDVMSTVPALQKVDRTGD